MPSPKRATAKDNTIAACLPIEKMAFFAVPTNMQPGEWLVGLHQSRISFTFGRTS
jgi:hypothetical protein